MEAWFGKYPVPVLDAGRLCLTYGTAGFRAEACWMDHVVVRCSAIAVLRSYVAHKAAVGLCITASHNPEKDNGVKLVTPEGTMFCAKFEAYTTRLTNAEQPYAEFKRLLTEIASEGEGDAKSCCPLEALAGCRVFLGRDTRPSSSRLARLAKDTVERLGAFCYDFGTLTTPQLHFVVRLFNCREDHGSADSTPKHLQVRDLEHEYYQWYALRVVAFLRLWWNVPELSEEHSSAARFLPERLVVDGANGVGALKVGKFTSILSNLLNVRLEIRNDGTWPRDVVNEKCGADYIQKETVAPCRFGPLVYDPGYLRCCSMDGDADRLVYFTSAAVTGQFVLVDGDKIASLYAKVIAQLLRQILWNAVASTDTGSDVPCLRVGVIQTGYANGASTQFLRDVFEKQGNSSPEAKMFVTWSVVRTRTGVKHLVRKAVEFDVAVYFESNGHGTIHADFTALSVWGKRVNVHETLAFRTLVAFLCIFERAAGDAMVDLIGVEVALRYLGLSFTEWTRLYDDFASVQRKLPLARALLDKLQVDSDDETILLGPQSLVEALHGVLSKAEPSCRAFVRPSGTENVCRIYAEAETRGVAEVLASTIVDIVGSTLTET